MLLPGAIAGVLLPQIAVLYAGRGRLQDVSPTYQRAVRYLALVSLPLGGVGVVLARPAVALAYGDGYEPMVPVLQVLVAAGTVGAIAAAASSLLYGIGRQNFILVALIGLAVLNLALDFVMIPRYAALGAAIAKGVAQGLGSAAGVLYVSRALGIAFPWRDVGRIALAVAGAMAITAALLPHAPASPSLGLALCTPVFAACFALGLKLLRVMNRDDLALWHRFRTGWQRR
jgi:O-antigen/teichoic acid export membrane protein